MLCVCMESGENGAELPRGGILTQMRAFRIGVGCNAYLLTSYLLLIGPLPEAGDMFAIRTKTK